MSLKTSCCIVLIGRECHILVYMSIYCLVVHPAHGMILSRQKTLKTTCLISFFLHILHNIWTFSVIEALKDVSDFLRMIL